MTKGGRNAGVATGPVGVTEAMADGSALRTSADDNADAVAGDSNALVNPAGAANKELRLTCSVPVPVATGTAAVATARGPRPRPGPGRAGEGSPNNAAILCALMAGGG